ncbi:MAG: ORC1-type DNA replication protein [Candidatus Asgardarchaeia archaeon]
MSSKPLDNIFERYISAPTLFKDREVLRPTYIPERLPHREEQMGKIGGILATCLKGGTPSNIFCYGKTGTGKTAVVKYILKHLVDKTRELKIREPIVSYINCAIVDTNYRVLSQLCEGLGEKLPLTGLPTDEVFKKFVSRLDEEERLMIIVLDEVDLLLKKSGSATLYELTRVNTMLKRARVSLIGISNDLRFKDYLDPRVLSSLSEEEIVFPPYTASELKDILKERAELGFFEGVLEPAVINLCAALAAREHGDARRALDLLRVAGELAEREGSPKVLERHVREAKKRIEADVLSDAIRALPLQSKLVLYAIYLSSRETLDASTGEIYNTYQKLCSLLNVDTLTQRRVSDLINELDMLGMINAAVISRGRYGRTRRIRLAIPKNLLKKLLYEDYRLKELRNFEKGVL